MCDEWDVDTDDDNVKERDLGRDHHRGREVVGGDRRL